MKKQEKREKAEKERKEEQQQKATKEEIILNEKEQLRVQLEIMEEGKVESEASESENDESHVKDHAPGVEQQRTEKEQNRHNDLREITLADCV